jgi:hypothetical protein
MRVVLVERKHVSSQYFPKFVHNEASNPGSMQKRTDTSVPVSITPDARAEPCQEAGMK